jgi:hypothetical protein
VSKAIKLSDGARKSGGVLVFVRKQLSDFVKRVDVKYEHTVVLQIDKSLLVLDRNIMLICMYIHPSESRYWNVAEHGYGIEILEQCIVDLYERFDDFSLLICGDLNSRTGCMNAVPSNDDDDAVWNESENDDAFVRNSDDKEINNLGRELVGLCTVFDCVILNGLRMFNLDDSLTFLSANGGSTIDYFIMCSDLCVASFVTSLQVVPLIESTHFPVSLCLRGQSAGVSGDADADVDDDERGRLNAKPRWISKIIWNASLENVFIFHWNSDIIKETVDRAFYVLEYDVDFSLTLFTDALIKSSDCMRKWVMVGGGQQQVALWFDADCRAAKNKA